ncbi:hypothetical protein ACFQ3W_16240 [Paenibacillus puldeungensis]|uniref:Uncharacterized protein n=1 Tax=Paenibacillus puldeungensis TaxID=696536 RepID=A0ABW3S083_9BACL
MMAVTADNIAFNAAGRGKLAHWSGRGISGKWIHPAKWRSQPDLRSLSRLNVGEYGNVR